MPDQTFASNYRRLRLNGLNYQDSLLVNTKSASNLTSFPSRLLNPHVIKPRGRRAGVKVHQRDIRQQNAIKIIITHREHESSSRLRGVNPKNIIQIHTQKTTKWKLTLYRCN